MEVPCERSREAHRSLVHGGRKYSGCGVIEYDAELALIFPAEFTNLERTGTGGGFPIDMTGGIVGHVVANEVEVIAASPDESLELARNHGKHFQKLVGRFHFGIDDQFAREVDAARFHQERKGKARGQAEVFLRVSATVGKTHFEVGAEFLQGG